MATSDNQRKMSEGERLHGGHRKRILSKIQKEEEVLEQELLEYILFNAIPRRNTNDIAHRLLSRFETINGVLSATEEELCEVDGIGENAAAFLLCLRKIQMKYKFVPYRKEELSREELQRLVLFANNPSYGFLIGAVGEALFGSKTVGIALFCITLLSASTLGLFLHIFFGKVNQKYKTAGNGIRKSFSAADFTAGVKRAFSSLLQVCAFVLFFSCISKCLAPLILELNLPQSAGVLLSGILEMTSGISGAITLLSPSLAFLFIAFFASFAGLSVALQIFSVAEEAHLPLWPYLAARLVQGALALLYASLFLWLFKPDFIIARSVAVMTPALQAASSPALLLAVLLPLLLLFLPAKKKGLRRRKPERKEKI